ncbi:hypothetical protein D0T12_18530 [Actinomadura spongiicola]|uniref:Uncharacterized protein n=1 Tax=Actinomadura spongiicola TaxID=2303421 RepID=A0A372GGF2_9ACTN|nr:hypothetical protein [Actinomadura spongiicola]RFS84153.1 hypothetical protein D0T12_18530 [Actinomadura spongiicola]
MQLRERLLEAVGHGQFPVGLLLDVQPLKQRLVQHSPLLVVATQVERLRILQQPQAHLDEPCRIAKLLGRLPQPALEAIPLPGDPVQLAADLGLRQAPIRRQVDEVLLPHVQLPQLLAELLMQQPCRGFLTVDDLRQVRPHVRDERLVEPHRPVVLLDRPLHPAHVQIRQLTDMVIPPRTEEVAVDVAVAILRVLEDQAPSGAAVVLAGPTEQRPLEVVVVHPASFVGHAARVDGLLHPLEQLLLDERLMPPPVLLTLVGNPPQVVLIPQQVGQFAQRDLPFRVLGAARHAQAPLVEFVTQVCQRPFARGVQLEGQPDERPPHQVNNDRPHLPVFNTLDGVEVADGRPGDRPPALGLLSHLVANVLPILV